MQHVFHWFLTFNQAHGDMSFWLKSKATLNRAITPRSIAFVTMCLTERNALFHCFSFSAFASIHLTNQPREEGSADSLSIAVFRSQHLVVRQAYQTASVLKESPLSGTSFLAYGWSACARIYSKHSVYNVCCFLKTFQAWFCLTCQAYECTTLRLDSTKQQRRNWCILKRWVFFC